MPDSLSSDLLANATGKFRAILNEVGKALVGHQDLVEQLAIAVVCNGHCILTGIPGAGQFRLVSSVANAFGLMHRRIALTPDTSSDSAFEVLIAPSGTSPTSETESDRSFPHVVFAEEIHRAPPHAQAALIETMVTGSYIFRGKIGCVPTPYLLVATEGPEDREPRTLTPQQTDRFLFCLAIGSPSYDEEYSIAAAQCHHASLERIVDLEMLRQLQEAVAQVAVDPPVVHFSLRLVRGTRVHEGEHHDFVYEWIRSGAGPRASQLLVKAARARALLHGRSQAISEDIRALAHPVLRHRISLNDNATSRGVSKDDAIDRLLTEASEREEGDERMPGVFREL